MLPTHTQPKEKTISNRDIVDAINKATENNDIDTYMSYFADDALLVVPIGELRGSTAIRLETINLMTSFATATYETTAFVESADTYAAQWKARLTNTGELHMPDGTTIPATGNTIEFAAAEIGHIENGRSARCASTSTCSHGSPNSA